jgi:hypothetical protein
MRNIKKWFRESEIESSKAAWQRCLGLDVEGAYERFPAQTKMLRAQLCESNELSYLNDWVTGHLGWEFFASSPRHLDPSFTYHS